MLNWNNHGIRLNDRKHTWAGKKFLGGAQK